MVIGTNSLAYTGITKISYTISCIIVSWVWFISLGVAGHYLHKADSSGKWLKNINKIAALIIWVIALGLATDIIRLSLNYYK
jgi:L-lysine exporter family protein LysE/ArgO